MRARVAVFVGLFVLLSLAADSAEAATRYVSASGTASWAECTDPAKPCSMATALSSYAAGDLCVLRGGTYATRYSFTRSGAAGSVVTFRPFAGETVTFTKGLVVSGSHLTFDGGGDYRDPPSLGFVLTGGDPTVGTYWQSGQISISGTSQHLTFSGWHLHDVEYASCFVVSPGTGGNHTITNFYSRKNTESTLVVRAGAGATTLSDGEIYGCKCSTAAVVFYAYGTDLSRDGLMERVWIHGPFSCVGPTGLTTHQGDGLWVMGKNTTIRNSIIDTYAYYDQSPDHLGNAGPHQDNLMTMGSTPLMENVLVENSVIGSWNDQEGWDGIYHRVTGIDLVSNVITTEPDFWALSPYHYTRNGDTLLFRTGGTMPGGLTAGATYYIVNLQSDGTFQLSTAAGGVPVDVTSPGSGTLEWKKATASRHAADSCFMLGGGGTVTFRNNVFMLPNQWTWTAPYNNVQYVMLTNGGSLLSSADFRWYNNIFWGPIGSFDGTYFRNNVFIGPSGPGKGATWNGTMYGANSDYNLWVYSSLPTGEGNHSLLVNGTVLNDVAAAAALKFKRYEMSAATRFGVDNDWTPLAGSPLLGAGSNGSDIGETLPPNIGVDMSKLAGLPGGPTDAGSSPADAGSVGSDAGLDASADATAILQDASQSEDAAQPPSDSGGWAADADVLAPDAAEALADAQTIGPDAQLPGADAGGFARDGSIVALSDAGDSATVDAGSLLDPVIDSGCGCTSGSSGAMPLAGLLLGVWMMRGCRQRRRCDAGP